MTMATYLVKEVLLLFAFRVLFALTEMEGQLKFVGAPTYNLLLPLRPDFLVLSEAKDLLLNN